MDVKFCSTGTVPVPVWSASGDTVPGQSVTQCPFSLSASDCGLLVFLLSSATLRCEAPGHLGIRKDMLHPHTEE